jgi:hypothetical protein
MVTPILILLCLGIEAAKFEASQMPDKIIHFICVVWDSDITSLEDGTKGVSVVN